MSESGRSIWRGRESGQRERERERLESRLSSVHNIYMFHSDQFGYTKHARAFRTQIDLKKIMQTNFGTESTHLSKV